MPRDLREFYFTIDLRSLGLYRLLLAGLLILDWFLRWPDLEAFYTSFGVLPVEAPLPKSGGEFHFCLLDGVTSLGMVRVVSFLGLVCYLLFLVGYRTRQFQFLSLVFFTSLLSRNVLIRDGSVVVLATMLLWTLFLPMCKRFSLDALLEKLRRGATITVGGARGARQKIDKPASTSDEYKPDACAPSLAALAVVAQIGLIYFFTASAKYGATWRNGTALYYALNEDLIARPLGQWLADRPLGLIRALTWGALGLEFAALPLILAPLGQPWLRRLAIVGLAGLHLGIGLTTTLSFFSATMIATYALLLGPDDWALLGRVSSLSSLRRLATTITVWVRHLESWLGRWVQKTTPVAAASPASAPEAQWWRRVRTWSTNALVAVLFITFALDGFNLNLTKRLGWERVPEPRWMRAVVQGSLIQHDWELFAPDPIKDDGWFVIAGETESGEQIDPLTGRAPTFEKPANLSARYDRFWRKYLERLWQKRNHQYRLYFAKYITRRDHRDSPIGHRLARFNFYFVRERTLAPGFLKPWPTESILLWRHDCFPKAAAPKPQEEEAKGAEPDDSE